MTGEGYNVGRCPRHRVSDCEHCFHSARRAPSRNGASPRRSVQSGSSREAAQSNTTQRSFSSLLVNGIIYDEPTAFPHINDSTTPWIVALDRDQQSHSVSSSSGHRRSHSDGNNATPSNFSSPQVDEPLLSASASYGDSRDRLLGFQTDPEPPWTPERRANDNGYGTTTADPTRHEQDAHRYMENMSYQYSYRAQDYVGDFSGQQADLHSIGTQFPTQGYETRAPGPSRESSEEFIQRQEQVRIDAYTANRERARETAQRSQAQRAEEARRAQEQSRQEYFDQARARRNGRERGATSYHREPQPRDGEW